MGGWCGRTRPPAWPWRGYGDRESCLGLSPMQQGEGQHDGRGVHTVAAI